MRREYLHLLASTDSDQAVVDLASRYLAAWLPAELAAIPAGSRPGAIRDVEDLSDVAIALTRARIDSSVPNARLDEMESFFAHACHRVSELEAAPLRSPGKSYLTR
jgi:hypothetical protein